MGRSNNRRQRRRRQGELHEPIGPIEFPGIMGWMQRNGKVLFLVGIVFMILSVGAGAFASGLGTPETTPSTPTPTETAEATGTADATPTEEPIQRRYASAPEMELAEGVDYRAVIHLEDGAEVVVDLLEGEAADYVNNFVFLARNRFYEGLTFHRVIPDFVAQAGDPLGQGAGGPGYNLPFEDNAEPFQSGALAMAKVGGEASGSQFFVTLGPTPELNDDHAVFGRVVEGLDVLQALEARDPDAAGTPAGTAILSIEILED